MLRDQGSQVTTTTKNDSSHQANYSTNHIWQITKQGNIMCESSLILVQWPIRGIYVFQPHPEDFKPLHRPASSTENRSQKLQNVVSLRNHQRMAMHHALVKRRREPSLPNAAKKEVVVVLVLVHQLVPESSPCRKQKIVKTKAKLPTTKAAVSSCR